MLTLKKTVSKRRRGAEEIAIGLIATSADRSHTTPRSNPQCTLSLAGLAS